MTKTNKFYVGIDPGKSPSYCIINSSGDIVLSALLKQDNGNNFPYYGYENFMLIILDIASRGDLPVITMELPHSVFGASAKANFQFGLSVGACVMGLESKGFSVNYVSPKTWTSWIWEDKDVVTKKSGRGKDSKSTSLNAAKRLLKDSWDDSIFIPTERSTVVNHNLIDAYLIAEYGRQLDEN